jgi:hypothetical protein
MIRSLLLVCAAVAASVSATRAGDNPHAAPAPQTADSANAGWTGTVLETMDAATYTYLQVDTGKEKIWAAAPQTTLKVGDKVQLPSGMPMKDFTSKALNRKFDTIYFVDHVAVDSDAHAASTGPSAPADNHHVNIHGSLLSAPAAPMKFTGLKQSLKGQSVKVRGKVVKYNPQIMGKNWVHIQDGTGKSGTDDLTITTSDPIKLKVGDTVLVSGTLALDKDFGYNYQYPVMLEDAKMTVE